MPNFVYTALSLDGFISASDGDNECFSQFINSERYELELNHFMEKIDAVVMGRKTFQKVCTFPKWPYSKPVFVLTNSSSAIPEEFKDKAEIVIHDSIQDFIEKLSNRGLHNLFIDGAMTIQNFLEEDLIDEMVLNSIPVLLGGGIPLFGAIAEPLLFDLVGSQNISQSTMQVTYRRNRVVKDIKT
jgi:dihydrofolate reductase